MLGEESVSAEGVLKVSEDQWGGDDDDWYWILSVLFWRWTAKCWTRLNWRSWTNRRRCWPRRSTVLGKVRRKDVKGQGLSSEKCHWADSLLSLGPSIALCWSSHHKNINSMWSVSSYDLPKNVANYKETQTTYKNYFTTWQELYLHNRYCQLCTVIFFLR